MDGNDVQIFRSSVEYFAQAVAVHNRTLHVVIQMEGMKAENKMREVKGESPAYTEEHFMGLTNQLIEAGRF